MSVQHTDEDVDRFVANFYDLWTSCSELPP